jgi:23S rRNA pseudouridine1911/1915/1917 synthase
VTPDRDGDRLDVFLAGATGLSRRAARRSVDDGLVKRNGEVLRVQSRPVATGDVIDIGCPESELGGGVDPPPAAPHLLFEDTWILVAAKPAGVLSQPAEGQKPGDPLAFDQQLLLALAWREGQRPFLRMVHRLDRMTSGAVLFARSPDVLPKLSRAWTEGLVERSYLAVIEGKPESEVFAVDRPIARDRSHRWRFQSRDGGKPSRTEVRVLATIEDGLSVVGCRLVTGRTHQVRVHLATAGHPVVGDRLYHSTRADLAERPLLHASALALPDPTTSEELRVVCPPPLDIAKYLPDEFDISAV